MFEDKREVIVILLKFLVRKIYTKLFESVPLFMESPEKKRKKRERRRRWRYYKTEKVRFMELWRTSSWPVELRDVGTKLRPEDILHVDTTGWTHNKHQLSGAVLPLDIWLVKHRTPRRNCLFGLRTSP